MASPTQFGSNNSNGPYYAAKSPTLSNTTDETAQFRGIYVGTSTSNAQDISVNMQDGSTAVFKNVLQGTIIPVVGTRINTTGTSATNLLILY